MHHPIRRIIERFRSAITGRYVTKHYAQQHPDTTIRERIDDPKPKG